MCFTVKEILKIEVVPALGCPEPTAVDIMRIIKGCVITYTKGA